MTQQKKKHQHTNTRRLTIRVIIITALALCTSSLIVYLDQTHFDTPKNAVAGSAIGGPYTLTDHTGQTRTDQDFQDRYKLIYFGFTYCPAICPTELGKITAVLNSLPKEIATQIQPLFITVDPERDTPAVLQDYLSLFHPRFIGLTGRAEQINDVTQTYRIYASKVQDDTLNDYTMDHSSYIYFMSPSDTLIDIYRIDDTPPAIIQAVTDILKSAPYTERDRQH